MRHLLPSSMIPIVVVDVVADGVPADGLDELSRRGSVHVHGVVDAAPVTGVVLHPEDLCVADEASEWQLPVGDGVLDVLDEAQPALALVAAGGDLHHGAGLGADNALERRRK